MKRTLVIPAAYLLDQVIVFYCLAQTDRQLEQIKQSLKQKCVDINEQLEKDDNHGVEYNAKDAGKLILKHKRLVERRRKLRGMIASYYTWSLILENVPQLACELLIAYLMTATGSDDAIWKQVLSVLYLSVTWSKRIGTVLLYREKVTLGLTYSLLVYPRIFLEVATRLVSFFLVKLAFFDLSPPAPIKMVTAPGPGVNPAVYGAPVVIIIWAICHAGRLKLFDKYLDKYLPRIISTWLKNVDRLFRPYGFNDSFLSYVALMELQLMENLMLIIWAIYLLPRRPETPDRFAITFLVYLALFIVKLALRQAADRYRRARHNPDENRKQKTD
jgi:hypothetical protein